MPHNQQYLDTVLNPGQSSTQPIGFSSAQQSQQARGKSYASPTAGEAYEARQRREQAAQILGNLELLVWHANVRNESVAQTRQHFQNVQLGLPDEHLVLKEEYEIPSEQRVKRDEAGNIFHGSPARGSPAKSAKGKEKEKEKEKEKGKRRVMSSGM